MECMYDVIGRGTFRGRPYDGPRCASAGVQPGPPTGRRGEAVRVDRAKRDSLVAADFHVADWTDESVGGPAAIGRDPRGSPRRRR